MVPLQVPGEGILGLALVGLVFLVGLAFFGAILYTEHRKEMRLIETGQYRAGEGAGTWVLAVGLLLVALGLADLLRAAWLGVVPDDGLTLTFLGLAALAYFAFRRREARQATEEDDGDSSGESGDAGDAEATTP
ncbi:MAG: hypothetical protein ABEJ82_03870 [Haloplanus sp.]